MIKNPISLIILVKMTRFPLPVLNGTTLVRPSSSHGPMGINSKAPNRGQVLVCPDHLL